MEIITIIISSGVIGVIVGAIVSYIFNKKIEKIRGDIQTQIAQSYDRWVLKRNACLKALRLANAILSNYEYPNVKKEDIIPQYITIEEARECLDELACACDSPDVLEILRKIMFGSNTPDIIVDLRNAVRRELSFQLSEIDKDREKAFIGKLNCLKS